jgi:DNA-directed RNA polymerase specialized sigma24 family protein
VDSAKVLSLYSNLKESAINNIDVVGYLIDIESALAALKPRHRLILTKICIEGYSQSEVAEMLGITKSTINGVYHNALIQFEKEFNNAKEN